MSGGSWEYITFRFDDIADRLNGERDPLRRLMGHRMSLLAVAMHDIEWVDSCDYSPGEEIAAIKAFLFADDQQLIEAEINAIADQAKSDIEALRSLVVNRDD